MPGSESGEGPVVDAPPAEAQLPEAAPAESPAVPALPTEMEAGVEHPVADQIDQVDQVGASPTEVTLDEQGHVADGEDKGRIADSDIAQAAAEAEKPERDLAHYLKNIASGLKDFDETKFDEWRQQQAQADGREVPPDDYDYDSYDSDLMRYLSGVSPEESAELSSKVNVRGTKDVAWGPQRVRERESQRMESRAHAVEEKAKKYGDWGEALAKHPPTKEFLEFLGLGELTPADLETSADELANSQQNVEYWTGKYDDLLKFADDNEFTVLGVLENNLDNVFGRESRQVTEFNELAANDDTTVGQLKTAFKDMCSERAEAFQRAVNRRQRALDTVREGTYDQFVATIKEERAQADQPTETATA